ncbi:hypothetical protein WSM22_01500 [Cytophagales bacterium WSM2-2]|nr:hypothetical protein WSM22_01500 [Cytophagales bacterium WSM2-2]
MDKVIVKLGYKQLVDRSAKSGFEQNVFNDTYSELLMHAPVYNREKKFTTVAEMIEANPKANSLHYKVGFAIGLYVKELGNKIPGLQDNLGNAASFEICKTEIVYSDLTDKSKHVMALTYVTSPLWLFRSFGEYLVVAFDHGEPSEEAETFTIRLQPNLSIVSYKVEEQADHLLPSDLYATLNWRKEILTETVDDWRAL